MKCVCVIILIFCIVSARGESKVRKDSEPHKSGAINATIQPLRPHPKPLIPQPPFKPDSSKLGLTILPPMLSPPLVQETKTPKPTKVKFNPPVIRSTPHTTNETETETPEPTNLLVATPHASPTTTTPPVTSTKPTKVKFNPPTVGSTPHTTNETETETPEPTNLLVTTPRASPTTNKPPVTSTKPTKVKFNPPTVGSTPHTTNETETETPEPTNLLVTTPRASPTTTRPPVTSTKPTKVKFNPPTVGSTPHTTNETETETPEPTNLLVTTPRASPTTTRPPVTSTKPTKAKFNPPTVGSTPHTTNETETETPEPTNLLVTAPRASPTTTRPPVTSTKPTKVKFNPPTVGSTPHTTNETETETPEPTNLLVTTPRASPTTTRPPVTSTKPTKVKFNPPTVGSTPHTTNETETETPEPTNLLVTTPRVSPTTTRPSVTSTKIPYWIAKSTPPSTSSGPLSLVSKQSSTQKIASILLQKPYNPCAPFKKPPLPDFRAPGRRISEVKCYDYIWELKVREDEAEQKNECDMWRARGRDIFSDRIVGGSYAISGDYPNMGAIGWKAVVGTWKFMCGCTLISHKFVLTAAHCSSASELDKTIADVKPKIIRLGGTNIQDVVNGTEDVTIVRIINHPMYKSPKKYFDIALMELDHVIKFTKDIQPACLWTKNSITRYGDEAQVTGWGVVESGSLKTSPKLREATVDIIDFQSCNRLLRQSCNRNWCGLHPEQLCAGKLGGGVDACQGDSGGPLRVRIPLPVTSQGTMHYVLGVTSFGVGCALPGLPGVYTKVSKFIDWLEGIVWPGQNRTAPVIDDKPDLQRFIRSIRF